MWPETQRARTQKGFGITGLNLPSLTDDELESQEAAFQQQQAGCLSSDLSTKTKKKLASFMFLACVIFFFFNVRSSYSGRTNIVSPRLWMSQCEMRNIQVESET